MNELDRYAVSLENMEVLRAQVEAQAREIERFKAARSEKGSRKALREMNAKLRAKIGRLERELAALSANHSEQVRDEWMVSLMGPDEVVRIQRKDGKWCGVTHLSESPRDRLLYEFLRTIAAPSAGSQREQGELR